MGRSQPTVRNLIEKRRDELDSYRRALRMRHQDSFDRLWEHAALDAPSIKMGDASGFSTNELILFAICRGQQREIDQLKQRLDEIDAEPVPET